MSFLCCGVKYSKNDPETYWCIDTDILEKPTKKTVKNIKVLKETVETLTCKKNGCTKIQIFRYGHYKGKLQLLERPEELKGKKAEEYLQMTSKIRIRQKQKAPLVNIPQASKNDFVYGKVINATTQRIRYLNEQGWASGELIESKIRTVTMAVNMPKNKNTYKPLNK